MEKQSMLNTIIKIIDDLEQGESEAFMKGLEGWEIKHLIDKGIELSAILTNTSDITPIESYCFETYINATNKLKLDAFAMRYLKFNFEKESLVN